MISPFGKTTVRPEITVFMKTVISGLTVVLPNGDIINTGGRTKKTSAGYNLTNLFIGSEGTLGIITEVHLRLSPIPTYLGCPCFD